MGKGSKRRPQQAHDEEFMRNWAKIFGNEPAHKPHHKAGCSALVRSKRYPFKHYKCNCGAWNESK